MNIGSFFKGWQALLATLVMAAIVAAIVVHFGETVNRNTEQIEAIQQSRAERQKEGRRIRELVAKSDLELCQGLYGNIYGATKRALEQTTLPAYRRVLPDLPEKELVGLVARARKSLRRQLKDFDPAKCRDLPSQQIIDQ